MVNFELTLNQFLKTTSYKNPNIKENLNKFSKDDFINFIIDYLKELEEENLDIEDSYTDDSKGDDDFDF